MSVNLPNYDVFEECDPSEVTGEWVEDQFEKVMVAAIYADVPADRTREAFENATRAAIEEAQDS